MKPLLEQIRGSEREDSRPLPAEMLDVLVLSHVQALSEVACSIDMQHQVQQMMWFDQNASILLNRCFAAGCGTALLGLFEIQAPS